MKKIIAKALTVILFVLSLFVISACDKPNQLDIYLIAGQSNACGYTPHNNKPSKQYENVWYAGMTDKKFITNTPNYGYTNIEDFDFYYRAVTTGMGTSIKHIGPEYGMAKIFNDEYKGKTKAFIFKTGAGGTSLNDSTHSAYGNWYPKSYWQSGYTPDITKQSLDNDPTGILYQLFVENFKLVYHSLKENGYNPVVKGMAWMQGEDDLHIDRLKNYQKLLTAFIQDIRTDLAEITQDKDLLEMPFVIGKISPSFGYWNNNNVPAMNFVQDTVAEELKNVRTIAVDDLYIVQENGKNKGPDPYHYCFEDMVTLGERFGEALLDMKKDGFLFF